MGTSSDARGTTLNLVADEHASLRRTSVELAAGAPGRVLDIVSRQQASPPSYTLRLPFDVADDDTAPTLSMPRRHALLLADVDPRRLETVLLATYDRTIDVLHRAMARALVDRSESWTRSNGLAALPGRESQLTPIRYPDPAPRGPCAPAPLA